MELVQITVADERDGSDGAVASRSPDAQATANWSRLHVWRYNPTSSTLLGEAISETSWVAQSL